MNYEIRNAKIEKTNLGLQYTDHGILSFHIMLDYGGAGQGFGGLCLDEYDEDTKERKATPLAASLLLATDKVFGRDWEKLPGTPCRAYQTNGKVFAIGHFLEDRWMWLRDLEFVVTSAKEMKAAA